ncbi:peptide-methionine (S)-S-oxide reductase [Litoreibacter arenae]|uniref:peptide-methionine (S)-S-oxide reductase n=1 Tax=Litoreibacter arenae DSM 19593 TaxID=1123360 RepID=S9QBN3_9RHOB|nr:peptide-methionine (S)-S-oxide reductase [Litoreibacter arenae]EPX77377.1 Peptide methionine sulfoxide reductase MsrA [Litoreibacter arenae DSM 19593]
MEPETIGFGGGCHWCTEAVFQSLRGVAHVDQGFIRADPPDDSLSEGVVVRFDPAIIPLSTLIEVHLRTHASTSAHSMRGKYRSAVYTTDAAQHAKVAAILADLQSQFDRPLVTKPLMLRGFEPSPDTYQDYYATHADAPFCTRYIDPKLSLIRQDFAAHV